MDYTNLYGYYLDEGLKLLDTKEEIEIVKTHGLNSKFTKDLSELRILKITERCNKLIVLAGYF
ncbi:MAG: hypothetical protein FH753_12865 [Firmicutes bacterium]|nr:hypothetical protein [Bacillota bacterium]MTI69992.1 hypothetical protein [Bacillota bacterium]